MQYRIDYYLHGKKVADDPPVTFSIEEAVRAARRGLIRYEARYARIVDPDKADKVVEVIHRDVLP